MNNKNKKPSHSVMPWIALSVCFLILVGAMMLYLNSPKKAPDEIRQRSVTLTDAGFDTPITFQSTCSESDFNKYLAIVKDTFVEYNSLFDQYEDYEGVNSLKTVNEQAADHPVEVREEVIELIDDSRKIHEINPRFDITEGRLLSLWHDARESEAPALPDPAAIEEAMVHTGIEGVITDETTISFADDSITLDLGAIAKGFAAQKASERLQEAGIENGFINAGGNVVLIGHKPDGKPWNVGIQQPDSNDSLVVVSLENPEALVTSGDYQRYMEIDGKRYSHIIDPQTGYPAEYVRSVTVITEDSTLADGMSTALFCMPVSEGMNVCEQMNLQAIWFTDRGTDTGLTPFLSTDEFDIYATPGIEQNIRLSSSQKK